MGAGKALMDIVFSYIDDFRDVFSKEAFDELPLQKPWDHAIDLTPGTELPCSQTFPLSPAEQKELDDFLQENLANGHICPSKSPMGAPVFFIKKKDGSLCLVVTTSSPRYKEGGQRSQTCPSC